MGTSNNKNNNIIIINNDTTAISGVSIQSITEQTQAKLICLKPNSGDNNEIVMNWSAKKAFGPGYLDQTSLVGTSAGNPSEQQYFDFYMTAIDGSSVATVYAHAEIEYILMWRELREISPS